MVASVAPAGDVTLMFTDIQGSTRNWDTYRERFHEALQHHNALIRQAIVAHSGYEVKTIGDSFMVAFSDPLAAARCALDIQLAIEAEPFAEIGGMRVRVGLHTDTLEPIGGDYLGSPVNRAFRIESAAHGGMILLSETTAQRVEALLPPGAHLVNLGLHRLKDLGAPQRIFQLSHDDLPPRDYPPIRTLESLAHNFPGQLTSFVGREREIEELTEMLTVRKSRLITLTGPGGTGKTRLSLQVAADLLEHYPDGIWMVELGNIFDAREVPTAVALALSKELPIASDADARAQVFAFLAHRQSLLVLDNFEQVIDAARFVSDLLRTCPNVVCLVTSRQLLQISGEQEFPVSPLMLPPPNVNVETCLQYASARLFVERCQAARPDFELTQETAPTVADICRRLEGLPLAVELTATLVRGMTPQQILPRLRDRFRLLATSRRDLEPRQRSLRGAIDWSYDLLSEAERRLFAQLSVFAGSFRIEDAEAVCEDPDLFTLLLDLRDKSLLKANELSGETRYSMLETLREYAREKLEAEGELDALRHKHAHYFFQRAIRLAEQITEGDAVEAIDRMTQEIDNMRAGLLWAESRQEHALLTDYSMALARYFLRRGPYDEAEHWLRMAEEGERKLAAQEDDPTAQQADSHTHRLARILLRRGNVHYKRAEYEAATACFLESLERFQHVEDWRHVVSALTNLGNIAWVTSRYREAQARWEAALEIVTQHGLTRDEADLLTNLAALFANQGKDEQARSYLEQALTRLRRTGDMEGLAYTHLNYGDLLLRQFDALTAEEQPGQGALLALAEENLRESCRLFQAMGNSEGIGQTTERQGLLALLQGNASEAEAFCTRALLLGTETGDRRCCLFAERDLGRIALVNSAGAETEDRRAAFQGEAAAHFDNALLLAEELQDAAEMASLVYYAGDLAAQRGNPEAAYLAYVLSDRECTRLELICPPTLQAARMRAGGTLPETRRAQIEADAAHTTPRQAFSRALQA